MEDKNVNNIEPNKKPHLLNRIISGVIDICLVFMSFYFLYSAFLKSSISEPMFKYVNILIEVQDEAKVESGYGYKVYEYESDTTNQIYTEEDGRTYIVKTIELSENYTEEEKNEYLKYYTAYKDILSKSKKYSANMFNYKFVNFGIVALTALVTEGFFFLVIPLIDKRGRTIGKMFCKTQVFSLRFENHPKWYHKLGRFFWILICETLIPFIIFNQSVIYLVPIFALVICLMNRENRALVDFVTKTKIIEIRSFKPLVDHDMVEDIKEN